MPPRESAVLDALRAVVDPDLHKDIVTLGFVKNLRISGGHVAFTVELTTPACPVKDVMREQARAAVLGVAGVTGVDIEMTAAVRATSIADGGRQPVDGIKNIIAVGAGKGGVGKSTVAVNLACALARLGYRTGLLDADVYGPSAPTMLGIDAEPEIGPDKKLVPLEAWGIKVISIGFLVDPGQAMIWRGPMASSAINQLLNDVAWGSEAEPLDVLVVDMPPGTGDIQLTMVQRVALAGAVLVSTPQEVALIDVRRGAAMFEKTAAPILGVVENMAYFPDPATGAHIPIFGRGGAQRTAEELKAPFLGEVPIDMALREACDAGRPIVAAAPDSPSADAFMAIAAKVASAMKDDAAKAAPSIVFED